MQEASGLRRGKDFVERRGGMGIKVLQHNTGGVLNMEVLVCKLLIL